MVHGVWGGEGLVAWKLGVAQWHVLGSIRTKWVGVGLNRAERTGGRDHGWWAEASWCDGGSSTGSTNGS